MSFKIYLVFFLSRLTYFKYLIYFFTKIFFSKNDKKRINDKVAHSSRCVVRGSDIPFIMRVDGFSMYPCSPFSLNRP